MAGEQQGGQPAGGGLEDTLAATLGGGPPRQHSLPQIRCAPRTLLPESPASSPIKTGRRAGGLRSPQSSSGDGFGDDAPHQLSSPASIPASSPNEDQRALLQLLEEYTQASPLDPSIDSAIQHTRAGRWWRVAVFDILLKHRHQHPSAKAVVPCTPRSRPGWLVRAVPLARPRDRRLPGSKRPCGLVIPREEDDGIADDIYEERDEDDIFEAMSPESDESPYLMSLDPMARCMSPGSLKREIALSSKLAQSASDDDVGEYTYDDGYDDLEYFSPI